MGSVAGKTIWILNESAAYLLIGFALAGVLHWLLSRSERFSRALATRGSKSVLLAALLGAPLPLCSCSVLPAGLALRKQGASKGATVSFLISVPETDVVSILITYGLLGPVMAVFRPIAALVTAIVTGLATNLADRWTTPTPQHDPGEGACAPCAPDEAYNPRKSAWWNMVHYGFVKFFDDIIGSLVFGLVLGGVITALLPTVGLERFAGHSLLSMLAMLVIGIPMYVCASSSTPIAVGLIAGGLSPGAALVFLLAGPATNTASLVVLLKHLGRAVVAVYLCSIAVISVLMGLWLDLLMTSPAAGRPAVSLPVPDASWGVVKTGSSIVFVILTVLSLRRTHGVDSVAKGLARWTGLRVSPKGLALAASGVALLLYAASGCFTVRPGERSVVTRFGRIVRSNLGPGLHYRWPYPIGRADTESIAEVRRVELGFRREGAPAGGRASAEFDRVMQGESWMLTGSEDIIDIKWAVQYRVEQSEAGLLAWLYGVDEPDRLVRNAAEAAIRAAVGCRAIDTLLTTERAAVELSIRDDHLRPALERCGAGVDVIEVSLLDVHAPPDVHNAFRDVASAAEEQMEIINTAYEYQERALRRAAGEAARRVFGAQGRAARATQLAEGESTAFLAQWTAYARNPDTTRSRMYLETVDAVFAHLRKYIHVPGEAGDGLNLWLIRDSSRSGGAPDLPFLTGAGRDERP